MATHRDPWSQPEQSDDREWTPQPGGEEQGEEAEGRSPLLLPADAQRGPGEEPAFDPFKYNSFPKNAGAQMWLLTQEAQASLHELEAEGRQGDLPPFLTFQGLQGFVWVAGLTAG